MIRKNSNWLIPELNSLKDLSTSSNQPLTVSSNHSWTKNSTTETFLKNLTKLWTTWCPCNNFKIARWRHRDVIGIHFFTITVNSSHKNNRSKSGSKSAVFSAESQQFSICCWKVWNIVDSNHCFLQAAGCYPICRLLKSLLVKHLMYLCNSCISLSCALNSPVR